MNDIMEAVWSLVDARVEEQKALSSCEYDRDWFCSHEIRRREEAEQKVRRLLEAEVVKIVEGVLVKHKLISDEVVESAE